MKLSVIHNVFLKNPLIPNSLVMNMISLIDSGIDYEYIVYNDKGDISIFDDIKDYINSLDIDKDKLSKFESIRYIYSDINYGKRICTGGYVGAIPYIKGELIHQIGQDDIFTKVFYETCIKEFNRDDIYFFTANAYRIDESLNIDYNPMININYFMDCSKPIELFKTWYGIDENIEVTRANNGFLAPGTVYKKELHDLIGIFDLDNFGGAADFEYWSRILYNEYKGKYINTPLWFYRISKYSAGNEIIDGKPNRGYWQQLHIQKIKEKYTLLVQQNKEKFK